MMRLSVFVTTICLSLLQALPSQAVAARFQAFRQEGSPQPSLVFGSVALPPEETVIAQRPKRHTPVSGRTLVPAKSRSRQPSSSTGKRRSPRSVSRPSSAPRSRSSRPKTVSPSTPILKRAQPKSRSNQVRHRTRSIPAAVKAVPKSLPKKQGVRRIPLRPSPGRTVPASRKPVKRPAKKPSVAPKIGTPQNPILKPTKTVVPKRATTTPVAPKPLLPSAVKARKRPAVAQPRVSRKNKPARVVKPKVTRTIDPQIREYKKTGVWPILRPPVQVERKNQPPRLKIRTPYTPSPRRVVRKRRAVPYWGTRRVRSRRLTRAYRPCYYCPGIGWSYSPICNTRSRRYYIYSNHYARLWPSITSNLGSSRRSYSEQSLARQVEIAIRDYAELYDLADLREEIEVTQEGSIIILSGEVEREETLEDIVAIARDIDGVRYVITEDVVVRDPIDSIDQDRIIEPDHSIEGAFENSEPGLVFITATEESSEEGVDE